MATANAKSLFEILMRENADMLLAYLRTSVRDPHSVDDLFQEAMVVAWRRIGDYDRSKPFGSWLRGIASKLVLAHYRKRQKSPVALDEASLDWLDGQFERVGAVPGDTLAQKLEALHDCVAALPEPQRSTIEDRYFKGLSLAEITERIEGSLEAVKKRLSRAKLRLEQCLDRKLPQLEQS